MTYRDRIVELRRIRAGDLAPAPLNWRRHPAHQQEAMKGILDEIGYADAVLARETPDGLELIDGHLRASLDDDQIVPVLVLDLDADEAKQLLVTLDPLAAMAEIDTEALSSLLADISFSDPTITAMLESLATGAFAPLVPAWPLTSDEQDAETAETVIEEVEAPGYVPFSERGQVWALGDHRLMCGDSARVDDVEALMDGKQFNLMVTDPPYGVAYETNGNNPRWRNDNRPIANDDLGDDQEDFWFRCFRAWPLDGDAYIFGPSGPLIAPLARSIEKAGIEHHQWLIWAKDRFALGRSHYHYRHEHIFYGWKGRSSWQGSRTESSVWDARRPSASPEHPTMKPVELIERAMTNSSIVDAVVTDPFAGSGTTIIAAEKLGRRCYAMEIEPRYVDVCIRRWEAFTGRKAVLA